ncbi:hypothetical protein CCHR01_02102 [Colletotrichum chrysophilum]|uniref:Uncharacterized protein n=1 Tax=Colletotrichum chrysophilum TaxID=1836956 RepID=A0AAD9AXR0_9PEZI|nr:hypothetical protein CCHR01_02102 [Colletotrichum chrysophilum]
MRATHPNLVNLGLPSCPESIQGPGNFELVPKQLRSQIHLATHNNCAYLRESRNGVKLDKICQ